VKTLLCVAIASTLALTPCYGQEAGSIEAYRIQIRHKQRQLEQAAAWRDSKKLTLLDRIPDSPHSQTECLSPSKLSDGSVGYLEYWQTEVVQIFGPTDTLLMIGNSQLPSLLLKAYPTKDLVDGDEVRLVGLVKIVGTESYTSVEGAKKTVRIVRLLSKEEVLKMEQDAKAAADVALFRTWTNSAEKHQVEAKFDGVKKGIVYLQRKDNGKTLELSLTQISKEDRKWIREELKNRRKNKPKTKKNKAYAR